MAIGIGGDGTTSAIGHIIEQHAAALALIDRAGEGESRAVFHFSRRVPLRSRQIGDHGIAAVSRIDLAAEYAPYTATGTAAGAALAALGVALKRPKLGNTLGALAASSGIVMVVMGGLTKRAAGGMGALYESFPPPAASCFLTARMMCG